MKWNRIESGLPPEELAVMTKVDHGKGIEGQRLLKRRGNYWFSMDGNVKLSYRPTHWKYV